MKLSTVIVALMAALMIGGAYSKCVDTSKKGQLVAMSSPVIEAIMKCHREAREHAAEYHSGMEVDHWSSKIADFAALTITDCRFSHTDNGCRKNRGGFATLGENIAAISLPGDTDWAKHAKKMCDMWVAEIKDYNLNTGKCNPGKVCGHYTQIIWGKTTHVGCAIAKCSSGVFGSSPSLSMTCQYGPAGNMYGELPVGPATGACSGKNVCGTHGRCFLSGSGKSCHCEDGYDNPNGDSSKACVKSGGGSGNGNSDKCKSTNKPCNNHGSCINDKSKSRGYRCSCSSGWDGVTCDHQAGNCKDSVNCNGHGKCKSANGGCNCDAGWGGSTCSLKSNPCAGNGNCHHGSTCSVKNNKPVCNCINGWTGPTCDNAPGGAWSDSNKPWGSMKAEVEAYRKRFGMTPAVWLNEDAKDAKAEGPKQGCKMMVDGHKGAHGEKLHFMFICGNPTFDYGKWLAGQFISQGAWPTHRTLLNAGCAIAKHCTGQGSTCGNGEFLVIACAYNEYGNNQEEVLEGEVLPQQIPNGMYDEKASFDPLTVGLGAAVVVLAVAVVVMSAKLRRRQTSEESQYTEMA